MRPLASEGLLTRTAAHCWPFRVRGAVVPAGPLSADGPASHLSPYLSPPRPAKASAVRVRLLVPGAHSWISGGLAFPSLALRSRPGGRGASEIVPNSASHAASARFRSVRAARLRSAALRAYAVLTSTAQVQVWKPVAGVQGQAPSARRRGCLASLSAGALDRLASDPP